MAQSVLMVIRSMTKKYHEVFMRSLVLVQLRVAYVILMVLMMELKCIARKDEKQKPLNVNKVMILLKV